MTFSDGVGGDLGGDSTSFVGSSSRVFFAPISLSLGEAVALAAAAAFSSLILLASASRASLVCVSKYCAFH